MIIVLFTASGLAYLAAVTIAVFAGTRLTTDRRVWHAFLSCSSVATLLLLAVVANPFVAS